MSKVLIALLGLAVLTVGFVALYEGKSPLKKSNGSQVTVGQWLNCIEGIETSCIDIIDDAEAYKQCSEADKKFSISTSPIKCPDLWGFLNHPNLINQNINKNDLFEDCFVD